MHVVHVMSDMMVMVMRMMKMVMTTHDLAPSGPGVHLVIGRGSLEHVVVPLVLATVVPIL